MYIISKTVLFFFFSYSLTQKFLPDLSRITLPNFLFLGVSNIFFRRARAPALCPTPKLEDQGSVFMSLQQRNGPVLYPGGRGVPFSLPSATRRTTVEVFEPLPRGVGCIYIMQPLLRRGPQTTTEELCSLRGPSNSHLKQQQKNCWERCFLCGPCQGCITRSSSDCESALLRWFSTEEQEVAVRWHRAWESGEQKLSLETAVGRVESYL